MKLYRPSEAQEQRAFFSYVGFKANQNSLYKNIFAIPNGGSRNPLEAKNLKLQGVKAGVPDIAVMIPNKEYHGLFIEMKVGKNKTTEKQDMMITNLRNVGYHCIVCYSSQEAIKELEEYLKNR